MFRRGSRIRFACPFHPIPSDFAVVIAAFVLSRLLARWVGVRLDVTVLQWGWQLLDLDLLRHELTRSLLYLHSQPPLVNLIVGFALKAEPVPLGVLIGLFGHVLGLATACALLVTFRRLGVGPLLRTILVTAYTISPWSLLYEHFINYEYIVAACLAGALALLSGFAATGRWMPLVGAFALLAAVPLTRSLFHVGWLIGVTVIVVLAIPGHSRRVLGVAVPALLIVLAWYGKNLVLFGSFSASSWLGLNIAVMTTHALQPSAREVWILEGKLSPMARVPTFSPLDVYTRLGVALPRSYGVPAVDAPTKKNGSPNLNHAAYIDVARVAAQDAAWVIRHQPATYLRQVRTALMIHALPESDFIFLFRDGNPARLTRYRAVFDGIVGGGILLGRLPAGQMSPWPPSILDALRRAPLLPLGLLLIFVASIVMVVKPAREPASRLTRLALLLALSNVLWVAVVGSLLEWARTTVSGSRSTPIGSCSPVSSFVGGLDYDTAATRQKRRSRKPSRSSLGSGPAALRRLRGRGRTGTPPRRSGRNHVPTRRVAVRSRNSAIVERYDSLPVRGFSEGTFSISTVSRPNSPWTATRCRLWARPGTAKIRVRVSSGPMPASESAASTLTLAGNARHASIAGPSKISVSVVIASRSILCSTIQGAPARPRGGLRVSMVTDVTSPIRAPLTPSRPAMAAEGTRMRQPFAAAMSTQSWRPRRPPHESTMRSRPAARIRGAISSR